MEFCTFASGSSGNCIFVADGDTQILVDAGISRKRIVEKLAAIDMRPEDLTAILITHEHTDHTKGLRVFSQKYGTPVYTTRGTTDGILRDPSCKCLPPELFHAITPDVPFSLGSLTIRPISVSHDAAEPVGYRIENGKKSFAVITDLGTYDEKLIGKLQNLDGVVLEANHDICMLEVGSYPYPLKQRILGNRGHLSNEASGQLLCEILHDHMSHIVLGHLSKENNMAELAAETVRLEVTLSEHVYNGNELPLMVAKREESSEIFTL